MTPVIGEPPHPHPLLRLGIAISERVTGRRMLPARLLAWSPRTALGAGMLEATTPHRVPGLPDRALRIARLTASLEANCAFCIDMNAHDHRRLGLTDDAVRALRDRTEDAYADFSDLERLVVRYTRGLSATPVAVDTGLLDAVADALDERALVALASAIASVHYWARFNQGLGVPPAGFGDHCLLDPP